MTELENPTALVGAVLNKKWRLTRVLGQGGLAFVFEAAGLAGDGPVAIKLLRREFADDEGVVARFLDEASTGERVKHAGVAKTFEAVRAEDGTPYLVMELLAGSPLTSRMNRGPIPAPDVVAIARSLLSALAAAHRAGVVHRDLKPDNIFALGSGQGAAQVRILDFGLARVMDEAGGMGRKTKTGMVLGTPGYMSPEQIQNAKKADARSDLWSLGVVIYEMLTGRPAFPADNPVARVTAVMTNDPTPIAEVAPEYAHWDAFFERALAKDVRQRFQTAEEMDHALLAASRGESISAVSSVSTVGDAALRPFGNAATEISAERPSGAPRTESPPPSIRIVEPKRTVSLGLALGLAAAALVVGVVFGVAVMLL